jgi:hypothetical protein
MRLPLQHRADATGIAVHAVVIVALVTLFNLTSLLKYRCRNRRRARPPPHPCTVTWLISYTCVAQRAPQPAFPSSQTSSLLLCAFDCVIIIDVSLQ